MDMPCAASYANAAEQEQEEEEEEEDVLSSIGVSASFNITIDLEVSRLLMQTITILYYWHIHPAINSSAASMVIQIHNMHCSGGFGSTK